MSTTRLPPGIDSAAMARLHRCESDLLRRAARLQRVVTDNPQHPEARELLTLASQLLELTWATSNLRATVETAPAAADPDDAAETASPAAEGDNVVPFPRRV